MPLEEQVRELAERLTQRFGLDALWIFGSQATGVARPDSDLDVAVLLRTRPDPVLLFELRCEMQAKWGTPLDLVDLDQASPVLALQVVKHGRLMIENDRRRRIDFVAHVPGRYEDLCIIRREAEKALLERVRHG